MMVTLVIKNVDQELLVKQIKSMYDLAYVERTKSRVKNQQSRMETAADLDAVMDMLSDALIINEGDSNE